MPTVQHLIALLFFKGIPLKKSFVVEQCGIPKDTLEVVIRDARARLLPVGLCLVESDIEISLVTAPEVAEFIEMVRKDELKGDIGTAGAETLAIIAYRGTATKAVIDRIRGVNSATMVRNLLVRGLIERQGTGSQSVYSVTTQCLSVLGVINRQELPAFAAIMDQLDAFEQEDNNA